MADMARVIFPADDLIEEGFAFVVNKAHVSLRVKETEPGPRKPHFARYVKISVGELTELVNLSRSVSSFSNIFSKVETSSTLKALPKILKPRVESKSSRENEPMELEMENPEEFREPTVE